MKFNPVAAFRAILPRRFRTTDTMKEGTMGSSKDTPTPTTEQLGTDAAAAVNATGQAATEVVDATKKAVEEAAPAVEKLVEDLKAEGHTIADSIKASANNAQVHELVVQLKAWINKIFTTQPPPGPPPAPPAS